MIAANALRELLQRDVALGLLARVVRTDHAHQDGIAVAVRHGAPQFMGCERTATAPLEGLQIALRALACGRRDLRQQAEVVVHRNVVRRRGADAAGGLGTRSIGHEAGDEGKSDDDQSVAQGDHLQNKGCTTPMTCSARTSPLLR